MTQPRLLSVDTPLVAAGYVRVSQKVQAQGYSPAEQRERIRQTMQQHGMVCGMVEEDHERGGSVTRVGYQTIIEAVREGRIHAVVVFMFDRWSRDGAEWLTRAREFDRLGVPIISAQEGRDEPGIMRFVRAGMAEEESWKIARRVLPTRERAARAGTYMGATPYGYKRLYPEHVGSSRPQAGVLLPDEATAWVIREMFRRYAAGGESCRTLALRLNAGAQYGPPPAGGLWSSATLRDMLNNPVYRGAVRYNKTPQGNYVQAPDGAMFVVEGTHEPLVDAETWQRCRERMAAARKRPSSNRQPSASKPFALATGILRCAGCGGTMTANLSGKRALSYFCAGRRTGNGCTTPSASVAVVDAALCRELARLAGHEWTARSARRLLATDTAQTAARVAALTRQAESEREALRKLARRMADLADDPSDEMLAAFRDVSAEKSARVRQLDGQIAALSPQADLLPALQKTHAEVLTADLPTFVADAVARNEAPGLRPLTVAFMASASIVERRPERHVAWVRLAITWQPRIATLLDNELLYLLPSDEAPILPTPQERTRERGRRRRERERAARHAIALV